MTSPEGSSFSDVYYHAFNRDNGQVNVHPSPEPKPVKPEDQALIDLAIARVGHLTGSLARKALDETPEQRAQ